ncbi:anthranilate phosphoribosyltransferase [Corynebacterium uterequi]|uniref:Anthranilate phosphoribosyltransferase n=1 Tax=Corynebacterium uterequi TaxID=1072256 RepID=A0A0G3HFV1_9CORY|nr:anthranilate phosphoribosyltransferase [Corynebacterium uterequi]AKK12169.1 anthranilate phosphoribosyltransferase [Corynebacterium uterequi]
MTSTDSLRILTNFIDNKAPTVAECIEAFTPLTVGDYDEVHIAALLTAVKTRGETAADLLGAARAFLKAGRPFPITGAGLMDTAGTGGDGKNTINITTGASLVAAAGGVRMVKCGNRSVSSKAGSADVLEAMKIPLDLDPERAVRQFEASNFTFLFAPAYNPAVGYVQPVRRALKFPTLFNTLGPILAPGRPEFQIMGIANPKQGPIIAEVFKELGRGRALVVHGDGSDEVSVTGPTLVWDLQDGEISHYTLTPDDFGVGTYSFEDLLGGDAEFNAQALYAVFAGEGAPAHRDAIIATSGAMFHLYGIADSYKAGADHARTLIDDGTVNAWLTKHEETNYAQ